ncbi:flagellar biosynthesis protein FlhF [Lachnospiraceae bacterium JLR.KK008]
MIIKKYQAKTEAEAVEQAKKELGQNVVIMNVRNMKKKGMFGVFKSKMVEVTAALEDDTDKNSTQKEAPVAAAKQAETGGILSDELLQSTMEKQEILEKQEESGKAIEEKLENLQTLLEKQLKPAEEEEKKETESPQEEKSEIVAFMQLLSHTMTENEVNENYANQIIEEIEKTTKANVPMDYILSNVYQKMILKFGKPMPIQPAENGPKILFFIGPTGVGKTTTIAKIASRFRVDAKKKVALLTADTYRIAAAEQLRTYANILEVPFRVIYSVEEIEAALKDFMNYDYILVDTAGHSHHNETQRDNMNQFIHSVDDKAEKEVFLVVSATTKYRDLVSIADVYRDMTEYKLIFTKLDETTALGNLLNLKLHTGAALSYVTCGQNVPDDIEQFNPQKTVKQLLGGRK